MKNREGSLRRSGAEGAPARDGVLNAGALATHTIEQKSYSAFQSFFRSARASMGVTYT